MEYITGEIWQSGQLVPQVALSTSQVSSGSREETFSRSQQSNDLRYQNDDSEVAERDSKTHIDSEHFTVSQDRVKDLTRLAVTDPSVLSQRDPNSQSAKSYEKIVFESEDLSSSQIPTAPLQLPETLDSHPPSRPPSISSDDNNRMSQIPQPLASPQNSALLDAETPSGVPPTTIREKFRNMRARSAALSKAQASTLRSTRSTISPSAFSDNPPLPSQELPNPHPLVFSPKMAVSQSSANMTVNGRELGIQEYVSQQTSGSSSLGPPRLGKMEFVVPLSMNARVTDQYQQTIFNYRNGIESFVQDELVEDQAVITQMETMIERINNITTHSDLDNDSPMTQHQVSAADEANWAEACSAKFQFLGHFLEAARGSDKHVVILASPGRLLDILETFLKARRAIYVRPDQMRRSDSAAEGPLKFTLLGSGESSFIISTAALVIAFDGSSDVQDPQITALRVHMLKVGQLSPVIHLLVANSAEHIDCCLPSSLNGSQRLQALVNCVAQTRHKVGQLPLELPGPVAAAEEVAAYLTLGGLEDQWTLPQIPAIAGLDFIDSSTAAESSVRSSTQHSTSEAVVPTLSIRKRLLVRLRNCTVSLLLISAQDDYDDENTTAKKSRATPVPDPTHVSDSISQHSHPVSRS